MYLTNHSPSIRNAGIKNLDTLISLNRAASKIGQYLDFGAEIRKIKFYYSMVLDRRRRRFWILFANFVFFTQKREKMIFCRICLCQHRQYFETRRLISPSIDQIFVLCMYFPWNADNETIDEGLLFQFFFRLFGTKIYPLQSVSVWSPVMAVRVQSLKNKLFYLMSGMISPLFSKS